MPADPSIPEEVAWGEPQTGYVTRAIGPEGPIPGPRGTRPLAPLTPPDQLYVDIDPEAYVTDAARERAAGWRPPVVKLDEIILAREALEAACQRVQTRRRPGADAIRAALARAADLTNPDPVPALVAAIEGDALDYWASREFGQRDSELSRLSYELLMSFRRLIHANARAVEQSLMDRPSPSAARLRTQARQAQTMFAPDEPGYTEWIIGARPAGSRWPR